LQSDIKDRSSLLIDRSIAKEIFNWYEETYRLDRDITYEVFRNVFIINKRIRGSIGSKITLLDPRIERIEALEEKDLGGKALEVFIEKLNGERLEEEPKGSLSIKWFNIYNALYSRASGGDKLGHHERNIINELAKGNLFHGNSIISEGSPFAKKIAEWGDNKLLLDIFDLDDIVLNALFCLDRIKSANDKIIAAVGPAAGNRIPNAVVYLAKTPETNLGSFLIELRKTQGNNLYENICEILDGIINLIEKKVITEDVISAYFCDKNENYASLNTIKVTAESLWEASAECVVMPGDKIPDHETVETAPQLDLGSVNDLDIKTSMSHRYLKLERFANYVKSIRQA